MPSRTSCWGSPAGSPPTRRSKSAASWSTRAPRGPGAHRRRPTLRRRGHVLGAGIGAGARRCSTVPDPIPHTHLGQTGRPGRRGARHRQGDRQVHARHLRRSPEPPRCSPRGARHRVPGDAHRDVGARRGPGEPGDAAPRGVEVVHPEEGRLAGGDVGSGGSPIPSAIVSRLPRRAPSAGHLAGSVCWSPPVALASRSTPCGSSRTDHPGSRATPSARRAARAGPTVPRHDHRAARLTTGIDESCGRRRPRHGAGRPGRAEDADVVVMAAAVADFRPKAVADEKTKKDAGLPEVAARAHTRRPRRAGPNAKTRARPGGVRGETDDVEERGREAGQQAPRPDGRQRRVGRRPASKSTRTGNPADRPVLGEEAPARQAQLADLPHSIVGGRSSPTTPQEERW